MDQSGYVTSATLTDGTNNYDVIFVASSWGGLSTDQKNSIIGSSWWVGGNTNALSKSSLLAQDLEDELDVTPTAAADALYYIPFWDAKGFVAYYDTDTNNGEWKTDTTAAQTNTTSTTQPIQGTDRVIYWAIPGTPGTQSNVPEPSTAIAMGLLGIVGFAGNRRRRRRGSVA